VFTPRCLVRRSLNPTHQAQKNIPLSIVGFCENVDFMASANTGKFLDEVESFLREHSLSATRFGVLAAGDTKFVNTLRKGRKVRLATEQRVRAWMQANGN
jgi:hypothetical protein